MPLSGILQALSSKSKQVQWAIVWEETGETVTDGVDSSNRVRVKFSSRALASCASPWVQFLTWKELLKLTHYVAFRRLAWWYICPEAGGSLEPRNSGYSKATEQVPVSLIRNREMAPENDIAIKLHIPTPTTGHVPVVTRPPQFIIVRDFLISKYWLKINEM